MLIQAVVLVALICSVIELAQTRGRSLLVWAVFLLALALSLPALRTGL